MPQHARPVSCKQTLLMDMMKNQDLTFDDVAVMMAYAHEPFWENAKANSFDCMHGAQLVRIL